MRKQIMTLVGATALSVLISGCGNTTPAPQKETETVTETVADITEVMTEATTETQPEEVIDINTEPTLEDETEMDTDIEKAVHDQHPEALKALGYVADVMESDDGVSYLVDVPAQNQQIIFHVSEETVTDREFSKGDAVTVYYGGIMTASLPPQVPEVYAMVYTDEEIPEAEAPMLEQEIADEVFADIKKEHPEAVRVEGIIGAIETMSDMPAYTVEIPTQGRDVIFLVGEGAVMDEDFAVGDEVIVYYNGIETMSLPGQAPGVYRIRRAEQTVTEDEMKDLMKDMLPASREPVKVSGTISGTKLRGDYPVFTVYVPEQKREIEFTVNENTIADGEFANDDEVVIYYDGVETRSIPAQATALMISSGDELDE